MKGILFSNYFMGVYFSILVLYCVVTLFIAPLNKTNRTQKNIDKSTTSDKHKIRDIIQLVIFLVGIISVSFFVMKYQIRLIIYIYYFFTVLLFIVIIPYVIWGFIHYIFIKPFDYELTETRKSRLGLTGIIMVYVCGIVVQNDTGDQASQFLSSIEPVIFDFFMIALLTIWYFTVLFFSLTFFILSMHDINVWARNRVRDKDKKSKRNPHVISDLKYTPLAKKIVEKIDTLPKGKVLKNILYNIIWFLCLLIDLILGFFTVLIDLVWKLINIIIFVPIKLMRNALIIISKSLSRNQGKTIIIISRVSLVSSLIIVYLIDKYQNVFTEPGSEIFEFMCSVIIIPLIITQLIELNNKQHVAECKIDQEL